MPYSSDHTPRPPPEPPHWFWEAIEKAHGSRELFRAALASLSREQLIQAYAYYQDLALVFSSPKYVAHMTPGMSEDGALDVGAWIVSQGREFFRDVYFHPDKTPSSPTPGTKEERLMFGDIMRHYLKRFDGEDMPDWEVEYPDEP